MSGYQRKINQHSNSALTASLYSISVYYGFCFFLTSYETMARHRLAGTTYWNAIYEIIQKQKRIERSVLLPSNFPAGSSISLQVWQDIVSRPVGLWEVVCLSMIQQLWSAPKCLQMQQVIQIRPDGPVGISLSLCAILETPGNESSYKIHLLILLSSLPLPC